MEKLSGHEIRKRWIAFFEKKGHMYIPGVPLVPHGDKSLLFVNAGVTGLKKYFDGSLVPPCRRIVNVQKSIRTNDIENVGHTARHHTFFEMLGNFSIGDYFRKEIIPWAIEILTDPKDGFGLDINKLYATYNPDDHESYELWQKYGMDKSHLVPLESNYWEIGEGPSGPNTEVFYDRGEKYDPEHMGIRLLQEDINNDRYIELWGIVFSQFNAVAGKKRSEYQELPSKNIDTGAGLERIACILQGTETNFETDLFMPIIHEVEKLSGKKYEEGNYLPFRVIADHARCLSFALSDGAVFSNEGRGYVLRRIIRRAMRYARKIGLNEPFMYKLVDIVTKEYGDFYSNLEGAKEESKRLIKDEEERFVHTLKEGEAMLSKILNKQTVLTGDILFKLYDTYGFPVDLTKEIAMEYGIKADEKGFNALMEEQKERARKARGEIGSFNKQSADLLAFKTPSEFLYGVDSCKAKVIGLFKDGKRIDSLDDEGDIAFDKTPFYSEMGGQISDVGLINGSGVSAGVVAMSVAPSGQHLHHVRFSKGSLKEGDEVELSISTIRRRLIERNHSATHLLHAALSKQLGPTKQEGSYVGDKYLRFDYRSPRKPEKKDLMEIEEAINLFICSGIKTKTQTMPLEEALKSGAEAEFGEKYGSEVRVVSFGDYSKELCGGTHVSDVSEIGTFMIASDEAVSSGVRRITAYTSVNGYHYARKRGILLDQAEGLFNSGDSDFLDKLAAEKEKEAELERKRKQLSEKVSSLQALELVSKAENINGIMMLALKSPATSREELSQLLDGLKARMPDSLILLVGGVAPRHDLLLSSNGEAIKKAPAGALMKEIAPVLLGSGGGKPNFAGGSAKSLDEFDKAVEILRSHLR